MTKKPKMTAEEKGLKDAAKNDKEAAAVYSDWLEEHYRYIEAAEQRRAAGLSELRYEVWWEAKGQEPQHLCSYQKLQTAKGALKTSYGIGWRLYKWVNHKRIMVEGLRVYLKVKEIKPVLVETIEIDMSYLNE